MTKDASKDAKKSANPALNSMLSDILRKSKPSDNQASEQDAAEEKIEEEVTPVEAAEPEPEPKPEPKPEPEPTQTYVATPEKASVPAKSASSLVAGALSKASGKPAPPSKSDDSQSAEVTKTLHRPSPIEDEPTPVDKAPADEENTKTFRAPGTTAVVKNALGPAADIQNAPAPVPEGGMKFDAGQAPPLPAEVNDIVAMAGSIMEKLGGAKKAEDTKSEPKKIEAQQPATFTPLQVLVSNEPAQDATPEELIELYFDLEAPGEKDALFDTLAMHPAQVVTDFFIAMMVEDEDEYLRALAAAEAAKRGNAEALELLHEDLMDAEEIFFFENALKTLCIMFGENFYPTLEEIWTKATIDSDERMHLLLALEGLDSQRTLQMLIESIENTVGADDMADDIIEQAMTMFARHDYAASLEPLRALLKRVAATEDMDAEERQELCDFLEEGIALIEEPAEAI